MGLILNIDTAVDAASICLARDEAIIATASNEKQKDHAAWLHEAIRSIIKSGDSSFTDLDAIAVTGGPGSYTGLRIGMAAAKGICYVINKPLISLNTLEVMAGAVKDSSANLLCPMIDARRMEVFTALYTKDLKIMKEPTAMVLDETSFRDELTSNSTCFFGNGSKKFKSICANENALFAEVMSDATSMISLSEQKFLQKDFADLAYAEPLYLKEFYTPTK